MKIVHGPYAFHTKFQFKRKKKDTKHSTYLAPHVPPSYIFTRDRTLCHQYVIRLSKSPTQTSNIVEFVVLEWVGKKEEKKEKEKRNLLLRRAKVSRRGTHTRAQKSRVNEENTARFRQEFQPLACFPHPRAAFPCDDHDHDTRPSTAAIHGSDMIAPRECNALLFARDNDRDVNVTRLNILRDVRVAL